MKKQFVVLFALCLALFLCACSSITNTVHFVHKNGVDYEVDTKAQTISDNDHTYQYHYSPGNSSYTITITYEEIVKTYDLVVTAPVPTSVTMYGFEWIQGYDSEVYTALLEWENIFSAYSV